VRATELYPPDPCAARRLEEKQLTAELEEETHAAGFDQEAAQARLNEVYERMSEVGAWQHLMHWSRGWGGRA
jgi:hypothetical protein